MAFQPASKIYFGTVPFNQSYKHVHYIPNRETQATHFLQLCSNGTADFTYQRMDNSVVVPYNAESLYGYNYCMFQNANYGSRWFYSFIPRIEYVNPQSSRLYLQTDIMQTWFPDCRINPCFVEREHVNNDAVGAHIKDEGFATGEMVCQSTSYDSTTLYIIVACAVEPLTDGTYVNVAGDNYLNVGSGVSLSVFNTATMMGDFKAFINALSSNGQQDAIAAIYMVPATTIPGISAKSRGWGAWVDASKPARTDVLNYNLGFDTLNGYRPKNNKMYCYPFEYAELSNLNGINQQLRLEFFSNPGTVSVRRTGGVDHNATTLYIPLGYNGMAEFYEGAVNMPAYPTCNWVYQAWANIEGAGKYAVELPSLVEDFEGNKYGGGGAIEGNSVTQLPYANNLLDNILNPVAMATGALNIAANLEKLQRTPNTVRGGTNSSVTSANIGAYKLAVRKFTCRAEIAKQIDDYLSVYGYNVSEVKTPNITGRQSWNYVKTVEANITGKVPAEVLTAINALFDRGITFWHTNDVGNYSLPNGIV